jgi:hypothetical protein
MNRTALHLEARSLGIAGRHLLRAGLICLLAGPVSGAPLTVSPPSLPPVVAGSPYNVTITPGDGSAPYHFSLAAGLLPPGLTLSTGPANATLSGTAGAFSDYDFTLAIGDSIGAERYLRGLSLPVTVAKNSILPLSPPGSTGPYGIVILSGALPPGMVIDSNGNLIGSPSQSGQFSAVVEFTDSLGNSTTLTLNLNAVAPEAARPIPTLSTWALWLLGMGMLVMGMRRTRT